ncbi:MAG: hypothetical protein NC417_09055 [Candidatus Gastranaerophilales bacterium]|nr:hypothetical protein [Candidatus Gastranaerophilales bacterium]
MKLDFIIAKKLTATERDAIENSISTIASTPYSTAPFLRNMGIKDYPPKNNSEIAKNRYATEVIAQTAMWEDRAQVSEIRCTEDNEARVVIKNG